MGVWRVAHILGENAPVLNDETKVYLLEADFARSPAPRNRDCLPVPDGWNAFDGSIRQVAITLSGLYILRCVTTQRPPLVTTSSTATTTTPVQSILCPLTHVLKVHDLRTTVRCARSGSLRSHVRPMSTNIRFYKLLELQCKKLFGNGHHHDHRGVLNNGDSAVNAYSWFLSPIVWHALVRTKPAHTPYSEHPTLGGEFRSIFPKGKRGQRCPPPHKATRHTIPPEGPTFLEHDTSAEAVPCPMPRNATPSPSPAKGSWWVRLEVMASRARATGGGSNTQGVWLGIFEDFLWGKIRDAITGAGQVKQLMRDWMTDYGNVCSPCTASQSRRDVQARVKSIAAAFRCS